jgi:hypothetical protein
MKSTAKFVPVRAIIRDCGVDDIAGIADRARIRRYDRPMTRKNELADRVIAAAESALAIDDHVSLIDVFVGIGWTDSRALKRLQQGQIDCLEAAIQANPARIAQAIELFRGWAIGKGLAATETDYVARTPGRHALRFSRGGDPAVECIYRTQWMSSALSEKKRERIAEKARGAPELVVIKPRDAEWTCHRCGGTGGFLMMENAGPACLRCVGLGDLEFLPAGDALLSRRVKAKSARYAVVVRFSPSRRRYERQGLLVEPGALQGAQREIAAEGRR